MDVEIERDGILLHGRIERTEKMGKAPALILFHGFTGNLGYEENDLYHKIVQKVVAAGVTAVRFDFNGHGKSGGSFSDMDVLREILDAIAILQYVRSLSDVSEVYLLGHSQGGVVGGMLAGMYPDIIKKLILLAPAATLKEDAIHGTCMGTDYDTDHIPESVLVDDTHAVGGHYFRIAKNLPIYETSSQFKGPVLLIHGIEDEVVDYQASMKYNEIWSDSILKLYDSLDHAIEGEDQEKAMAEIVAFIQK